MTGILNVLLGGSHFTPVTTAFTSGSGNITIPAGATTMVLEAWGSGGMWYTNTGLGYSGGSGAYSRSSYSVNGQGGKTVAYAVGAAVTGNGASGNASTLSSGTFSITSMSAGGGAGAASSSNGAGGTASGGNAANTSGNAGSGPNQNNVGGSAISGVNGGPYGAGGSYNGPVNPGGGGIVVRFT